MNKAIVATTNNLLSNGMDYLILSFIVACVLCAPNGRQASAQSRGVTYRVEPAATQRAISRLKSGNFSPFDVEVIARSKAVTAIPVLETQFKRSKDLTIKGKIANALVRLGIKNGPYWKFLETRAYQVLRDEPPTALDYDDRGKAISSKFSPRFVNWARTHHMSAQQAWNDATFEAVAAIMELGSSNDERADPILRQALTSDNDFVKVAAAQGLAELDDSASIPLIIEVCKNSPSAAASAIAQYLVYFNDPAAKRAVDEYVPKSTAQELREAVAHGKTPYH